MNQLKDFKVKVAAVLFLLLFINGCGANSYLIQKKDINELNQKITQLQNQVIEESKKADEILAEIKVLSDFTDQDIDQNYLYFKALSNNLKKVHHSTSKKLKKLNRPSSIVQYEPQPENVFKEQVKPPSTDKLIIGKIEKVLLTPPDRIFHARIDTGATTSSLDAKDMETFERDGDSWIKFKIKDPKEDILYDVEKPIVRWVKIIQASAEKASRRPVIELQFQIGHIKRIEEFTLEDRSHLDYQVLIGRNILRDLMIVDVSHEFLVPIQNLNEKKDENKN